MNMNGSIVYEGNGNLYLNITNRCTNDCIFCIRKYVDGIWGYRLMLEREPSLEDIINVLDSVDVVKYDEVVFTGFGEPLMRLDDVIEITKYLKERGVKRVRLDTNANATLLYPHRNVARELKESGMDAVSISLNAQNEKSYEEICNPKLMGAFNRVIEFATECVKEGMDVRLTVVGHVDVDVHACEMIARKIGADFYVR